MKERFENRRITGTLKVACKFEDGGRKYTKYWEADKQTVVSQIIAIVNSYSQQGYRLTLRQLHYQFVTRNWIVNHTTAYKKLGTILDDCRYSGLIDWNAIEDRGRVPYLPYWAHTVSDALAGLQKYYRVNRQKEQPHHIELWTEKDALSGILRRSTEKYHIQLVVNKGYTSSSAVYGAYKRLVDAIELGQKVTILYFGDHDPSGLDMVRDIRERLKLFLCQGVSLEREAIADRIEDWRKDYDYLLPDLVEGNYLPYALVDSVLAGNATTEDADKFENGVKSMWLDKEDIFEVRPIGLTMEQIKQYNLPANPAKLTDTRSDKYVAEFGVESWEVDALDPVTLTQIVETNIESVIDREQYEKMLEVEAADIERFTKIIATEKKRKK